MSLLAETLERIGARVGGLEADPVPLEGGITNRNYRTRLEGVDVVVRLPGKDTGMLGIDRGAERAAAELAARRGVGPEVVATLEDPPCLITRFVVGEAMSAERLRDPAALAEVAAALRSVHDCGERLPVSFSPFRIVEDYAARIEARGAAPPADYGWGRKIAGRIEEALRGPGHEPVPCHDDLLAANFIASRDGIRIVDWEYAGMNDRFFDLGNFAVNNGLEEPEEEVFLTAYFGEPPTQPRLASMRLMQFVSDFREAMWGAVQSTLSDLDFDFDAYAVTHFERMRTFTAHGTVERLLKEADAAS